MSDCTHDCSTCSQSCSERKTNFHEKLNDLSSVKKVIAVVSGKGGVGKSLVTSMLAVNSMRNGYHAAILDADITGPSIPNAFGVHEKALGNDFGILPVATKLGIDLMSINLLLENETDPVVWRGPILAGTVKQFWSDVIWGDVDNMFIDCPPGTGDVPLTIFQSLPIDGIIIVTSPQDLVSMIVEKAVKMAQLMNVPIVGIVENMAYFVCDKCNEKHYVFGKGNVKQIAAVNQIENYCQIPFDKTIANLCDRGLIELHEATYLEEFFKNIIK